MVTRMDRITAQAAGQTAGSRPAMQVAGRREGDSDGHSNAGSRPAMDVPLRGTAGAMAPHDAARMAGGVTVSITGTAPRGAAACDIPSCAQHHGMAWRVARADVRSYVPSELNPPLQVRGHGTGRARHSRAGLGRSKLPTRQT
jgi:hypothetical protein